MTSVPGRLLTGASVVIVGAGMAGLAVAAELERRGHTDFLLLEAGPDRGFGHYRTVLDPATALQYWLRPEVDPDFWRPYEQGDASFGGLAGLRRRTGASHFQRSGVRRQHGRTDPAAAVHCGQGPANARCLVDSGRCHTPWARRQRWWTHQCDQAWKGMGVVAVTADLAQLIWRSCWTRSGRTDLLQRS